MFGLLNINKPVGWTSRDVVNRVYRIARPYKVGHAGTLDPLATGVLVICIGQATRLIEYVQQQHKRYRGTFLLGRESDTEDITGVVVELDDSPQPSLADLQGVLPQFTGSIQQHPPAYSAIHVQGKRSYKLARKGKAVALPSRAIDIFALNIVSYNYPELVLDIHCGSGTYVRSLGRDIAQSLGTNAVMSALERTAIGMFSIDDALDHETLTTPQVEASLLSPLLAVEQLPKLAVNDEEVIRLVHGKLLLRPAHNITGEVAAVDALQRLIAIVYPIDADQLKILRAFPPR